MDDKNKEQEIVEEFKKIKRLQLIFGIILAVLFCGEIYDKIDTIVVELLMVPIFIFLILNPICPSCKRNIYGSMYYERCPRCGVKLK